MAQFSVVYLADLLPLIRLISAPGAQKKRSNAWAAEVCRSRGHFEKISTWDKVLNIVLRKTYFFLANVIWKSNESSKINVKCTFLTEITFEFGHSPKNSHPAQIRAKDKGYCRGGGWLINYMWGWAGPCENSVKFYGYEWFIYLMKMLATVWQTT